MGSALSPRVREQIVRFDPDVEQVSVSEFCRRAGISTSSFYRVRDKATERGLAATLVPESRAPKHPATIYTDWTRLLVRVTHAELVAEGKDCGPWSVEWRLFQREADPLPSRSTIARILRSEGLSAPSPRKRPRASYRRFRRARANELWQLDGMEWHLPEIGLVTIYHVVDDHSRLCPALIAVAGGESTAGARQALQSGIDAFGPPQSVLSDNGAAFNQHRRGRLSATEVWLAGLGIRPISGRVSHPQTQGKVERSHQPLQRWLHARTPTTLQDLTQALDGYRNWYNHERQHQGLGHHLTPMAVWQVASKAGPEPRAIPLDLLYSQSLRQPTQPAKNRIEDRTIGGNLRTAWKGTSIGFGPDMAHQLVHLVETDGQLDIFDDNGELHASIPWPSPTKYVSVTQPPHRLVPVIDRRTRAHKLSQMS